MLEVTCRVMLCMLDIVQSKVYLLDVLEIDVEAWRYGVLEL